MFGDKLKEKIETQYKQHFVAADKALDMEHRLEIFGDRLVRLSY